jgi:acyl-coenzyme A synthetase/AMP-(fatty) acid ligase
MDMLFSMRAHEAKRHLVVAPMTHFAGSFIFALTMTGSTHVLLDKADPLEILQTIEKEKIQILFLPPTVIYMLLACEKIKSMSAFFSGSMAMRCLVLSFIFSRSKKLLDLPFLLHSST